MCVHLYRLIEAGYFRVEGSIEDITGRGAVKFQIGNYPRKHIDRCIQLETVLERY